ncbi:unnamed protein product [Vitrella brassicaformis CCMP3155]|uniref:Thioredoxin domain-containing protein n=1 Tax=Vitrella brassicaformis (strain CCMP3155) TaxID=1169540 RepID=A0A0G4EDK8_VITBC|nr:unnamed protein product [Vitrella brassicaformis CCMP3155]|eukprot:CEL93449.1 unnamed protein product [Vitrella brassicaformis CCMP3155]
MHSSALWLLPVLLGLLGASLTRGEVHVLTSENFTSFVEGNDRVLAEFYAPWCGHCKALEPEYTKAADMLTDKGAVTKLAKIDATEQRDLAETYGVKGYPTLRYFDSRDADMHIDYSGPRDAQGIVSWLTKREVPSLTVLDTEEAALAWAKKRDYAIVAYGLRKGGKKSKMVQQIAEDLLDNDEDFAIVYGATKDAPHRLMFYRSRSKFPSQHDATEITYKGSWSRESIEDWIAEHKYPFIRDEVNTEMYLQQNQRRSAVIVSQVDTDRADSYHMLEPIIKKYRGKLYFTYMDPSHVQGPHLGLKGAPKEEILILDRSKVKDIEKDAAVKYRLEGPFTEKKIEGFFGKWEKGKLKAFKRSAPIPESEYDGNVRVLVGDTWESVVMDKDKDVFVEYYAPW